MSTIVYVTEGDVTDLSGDESASHRADTLFDGLLEAAEDLGQVTWTTLTWNIVIGRFQSTKSASDQRVAVFDLDTANGLEVIHTTNYVNGHTDAYPSITK